MDWGVAPKTENFTQFWDINASQGRIRWAIFTTFSRFVGNFMLGGVLKFEPIRSRGFGVMGI